MGQSPELCVEIYRNTGPMLFRGLLCGRLAVGKGPLRVEFDDQMRISAVGAIVESNFSRFPLFDGLPREYEAAVEAGARLAETIIGTPIAGTLIVEAAAHHPIYSSVVTFKLASGLLTASHARLADGKPVDDTWLGETFYALAVLIGVDGLDGPRQKSDSK